MEIKVLIVEDDVDLGQLLQQYMEMNGLVAKRVFNGVEARNELKTSTYDIIVIDVMMPLEDGFVLAEKISIQYPQTPFLFVTARKMKADIMKGLKLGADDYIVKPFDADELIQRIRNILKRTKNQDAPASDILPIGVYHFDPKNLLLRSPTTERVLTEKEAQLLHYLYLNKGQLIKRTSILDELWEEADFFKGRSMDVFVSRLRKYLAEDPAIKIESIRGVGFRFLLGSG
ncbi:response regulator transcription factor [Chitinophaga nivalis]|uniref:Response regulator transcription factor n=1 Tax=Chitinophaga nivalis TaxID=2991709 RepID=A0ABT3IMH9_9BACT|nr:response regulator transcription factor [Chitinophaga nivalis]MCW3465126.1 response regulator transcription factor [Chitinophaga nivalis]MCW3485182.1 response regulator transcription factor [Chitinophaga nivalis]